MIEIHRIHSSDSSTDRNNKDICRICHSGASETSLISPCRCAGSIQYSHPKCLMKWLARSGKMRCELCGAKYNLILDGYKPIREWRMMGVDFNERLHLTLLICCLLIMVCSVAWWNHMSNSQGVYSSLFQHEPLTLLLYITYGPLNVLCVLLTVLEIKLIVLPLFDRWEIRNIKIKVLPYGKSEVGSGKMDHMRESVLERLNRSASYSFPVRRSWVNPYNSTILPRRSVSDSTLSSSDSSSFGNITFLKELRERSFISETSSNFTAGSPIYRNQTEGTSQTPDRTTTRLTITKQLEQILQNI